MIQHTQDFFEHLKNSYPLDENQLRNLLEEVAEHWNESPRDFVRRRHIELQRAGLKNDEIYSRLMDEMNKRRFCAEPFTERQLRRTIYG